MVLNVTVALRDVVEVLASTLNVTSPFPDPLAVSAANQDTPDCTLTFQAVFADTATVVSPAVAAGFQVVGSTVSVGAAPA